MTDVLAKFDDKIAGLNSAYQRNVAAVNKWKSMAADLLGAYERDGVVDYLHMPTLSAIKDQIGCDIRRELEKIADVKGWTFVVPMRWEVQRYIHGNGYKPIQFTELVIPRNKRTPAIASLLLLQAQPGGQPVNGIGLGWGDHPLEVETKSRSWAFRSFFPEGDAAIAQWVENVRTDMTYRIILGLE